MQRLEKDKKVVIFSSKGGGGHVAAAEAIIEALGENFSIEIHNALSDVFQQIDLISRFTKKRITAEDSYNFFLKKRIFFMANAYGIAGKSYMNFNKNRLIQAAIQFLKKKQPKIVVSVIPFFNGAFQEACQRLNIPFWIIPTDVEIKSFLYGINKEAILGEKIKLALAYDPQIQKAIKWGIPEQHIVKIGFPVKQACVKRYHSSEIRDIKRHLKIGQNSKVITLTLGATGTSLFYKLLKSMTHLPHKNLEMICCAGKDRRSFKKAQAFLEEIGVCEYQDQEQMIFRLPSKSRLHLFCFTNKLPQIMAISHLIVSKSGSLSVSEAIHLKKYLLLDHTLNSSSRILYWERPNLEFVKAIQTGDGFYSRKDLISKIEDFLKKPKVSCEEDFLNIHQNLLSAVQKEVD